MPGTERHAHLFEVKDMHVCLRQLWVFITRENALLASFARLIIQTSQMGISYTKHLQAQSIILEVYTHISINNNNNNNSMHMPGRAVIT